MKRAEINERLAKGERMVVLSPELAIGGKTFKKGDKLPPIAARSFVETLLRAKSAAWEVKKPAAKKAAPTAD